MNIHKQHSFNNQQNRFWSGNHGNVHGNIGNASNYKTTAENESFSKLQNNFWSSRNESVTNAPVLRTNSDRLRNEAESRAREFSENNYSSKRSREKEPTTSIEGSSNTKSEFKY